MSDKNPKLKTNLVQEAVFEIRFKPTTDFTISIGELKKSLEKDYPTVESATPVDFPDIFPELDNIVRYRFFSQDRSKLYSAGRGLLSVNILKYEGFESFLKEILRIMKIHKSIFKYETVTRLGLRYINRVSHNVNIDNQITISANLPSYLKNNSQISNIRLKSLTEFGELSLSLNNEANEANSTALIDIDIHKLEIFPYEPDIIKSWIINSHQIVYECFKSSISNEYYEWLLNN
jgi:uncharacterized protein (TIGR04255 family)